MKRKDKLKPTFFFFFAFFVYRALQRIMFGVAPGGLKQLSTLPIALCFNLFLGVWNND